jgi:hypothetical protein
METDTYIYQKTKVDNNETLGKIARLPNSTYKKLAVRWLNEALWLIKHSFFV